MGSLISKANGLQDVKQFKELNWMGSFEEYLAIVKARPQVTRNAYQRMYDMIMSKGSTEYVDNKKTLTHYHFFDDPDNNGAEAIFGLDIPLMRLMEVFKSAACGFSASKRLFLLLGPVGSAKSTIARLLKQGLERYSKTDDGALYTFDWVGLRDANVQKEDIMPSAMNEDPLRLFPAEWRTQAIDQLGLSNESFKAKVDGELDPASRLVFKMLMEKYEGNWEKVMENHIRVRRFALSEKDRIGIGTFQPKDEKNQDSTELTGDINYRKIAEYGSDSDPRAFNFDGEFCVGNRGIVEFIELLKLDTAFLYDLLEATQSRSIKPKKHSQVGIDEVILGHTNEAEYQKLMDNKFMSALKDRTVVIQIPYITKLTEEQKIYAKDFGPGKVGNTHVAPHTLKCASMFSILTRLEDPKKHNLSLLQKMKLYDGKQLPGYTQDTVKELRKEGQREGMDGISPRYIQDKISNALVNDTGNGTINPFMIMNELEKGLKNHALINNEDDRKRYMEVIGLVKREYEEIVKNEVQRAISADEDQIAKLCGNYIDNIKAFTLKEKVKNVYTGKAEEADERLMRSIEEKIEIPESRKKDFRSEIMNFIGALSIDGKKFTWETNDRLRRALELKLFEDQRDTIKLKNIVSGVMDKDQQEKIDIIKARMIKNFGYNSQSANDVLAYVSSIFARGDVKE
jgi:serine protein kinase